MSRVRDASYVLATLLALSGAAVLPAAAVAGPEAGDDRSAVERVGRDYLEGWYTADAERLGRALHPDLVKRYVGTLPSGRQVVHTLSREAMVEMTRAGGGSRTPVEARTIAVQALEVSGEIAVVRASSVEYVEYLSLAKCNGQWVIVNILWRFQSPPARPGTGG